MVRQASRVRRLMIRAGLPALVLSSLLLVFSVETPVHGGAMAMNGMVASPSPMAAQAGLDILRQGGNAFDAAVATVAVAFITDSGAPGLGGTGYAVIYDAKKQQVRALDFIGAAPAATKLEMFTEAGARLWDRAHPARDSIKAVLIPGTLSAMAALLDEHGTLSWEQVLAPAIRYAEEGYVMTPRRSNSLGNSALRESPYGASIFYRNGRPWPAGEVLKQPETAETLKAIAADGPALFYGGALAERFAEYFQDNGGILTVKDFADYRARWREPLKTTYRGYDVYSHPPGSGGMTVLQALNVLERFDIPSLEHNSPEFIHLVSEVLKLAFVDDDAYNSGKDYAEIPLDRLLSKDYAAEQAARVDPARAQFYPPVRPGSLYQADGTINHVIVDREHNIVALTHTGMHTRVGVPGTGVFFNSDMTYFSVDPQDVNVIEAGQRPRLVMSPTIAFRDGKPVFALGAGGGWTINQTVLQVLLRAIDFGMDAGEAVKAPRFVLRYLRNAIPYMPGTDLDLEPALSESTRATLVEKGHRLRGFGGNFGGVTAVTIYPGSGALSGTVDPRREGQAVGW